MVVLAALGGAVVAVIGARFGLGAMTILPVSAVAIAVVLVRPWSGPALVFASVPAGQTGVVGPLQLVDILTVAVVVGVAAAAVLGRRRVRAWHPSLGWALVFAGVATIATFDAVDVPLALRQLAQLGIGVAFAFTVLDVSERVEVVRLLVVILVGAGLVAAVMGLAQSRTLGTYTEATGALGRPPGPFSQPNELGSFLAAMLPLGAVLTLGARRITGRLAAGVASVVMLGGLVATLSRGAWFAAAVGSLVLIALSPRARLLVIGVVVPAVAAAVLALHLVPDVPEQLRTVAERIGSITDPAGTDAARTRTSIWAEAVRQTAEAPVLGQSPGNYGVVSRRADPTAFHGLHGHNLILNTSAEMGLLGVVALLALMAATGVHAVRGLRAAPPGWHRILLVGLTAALVAQVSHGLVDYPWRNPVLSVVLWGLVGLLLAASRLATPAPPGSVPSPVRGP